VVALPTREVYHKGPGMIFRRNPKTYLTEIQIPIEPGAGLAGSVAGETARSGHGATSA
jgi:hypothetical protein